jgi:queuine/archaeosine tRNA-ribosyltransferase
VPELTYFQEHELSPAASNLVRFDADSIRQAASADGCDLDVWLVDPAEYERNGRLFRDSESPRMLAYSTRDQILYATDGCNTCARHLPAKLQALRSTELKSFAEHNELRVELLEHLASLLR